MCMPSPNIPNPKTPTEYEQSRAPDAGAVKTSTGRRTLDKMRSMSSTILTSGSGVTTSAPTDKKTLLGA